MKVCLLANAASIHTVRWANSLSDRGVDCSLATLHAPAPNLSRRVKVHQLRFGAPHGYFVNAWALGKLLRKLRPDLLHTHYASGYGMLGRLCRFHPQVLSVWGSDVYDVPWRSPLHRRLVVGNLLSADLLCSTSQVMAHQTDRLLPRRKRIEVTPFGIDTSRFRPQPLLRNTNVFTIGTVKTLAPKYGIDTLLEGFAVARERLRATDPSLAERLCLRIVGDGPQCCEMEKLARSLAIDGVTQFTGSVPHELIPQELNRLDIYVAMSRLDSESFGVAILEASACGLPVVVSNVGGLPEVVENGKTGFVIPKESPCALADVLESLCRDPQQRARLGENGTEHVRQRYEWHGNVSRMLEIYDEIVGSRANRIAA
jgi:glycosyltransferase involved in cell wall biosynthesis